MDALRVIEIAAHLGMTIGLIYSARAVLRLESTLGRVREVVAREAAVAIVEDAKEELEETHHDPILGG